jgi:hypothetical protein
VAWSLLLKLEERAHDWFDSPVARQEAARAATLVRLQVNKSWRQSLTEAENLERAAWCGRAEERMQSMIVQSTASPTVLRLTLAVPLLLEGSTPDVPAPGQTGP